MKSRFIEVVVLALWVLLVGAAAGCKTGPSSELPPAGALRGAFPEQASRVLQRHGYDDLDAVRAEEVAQGILAVLAARGLAVDEATSAATFATRDLALLRHWLARTGTVERAADLLAAR